MKNLSLGGRRRGEGATTGSDESLSFNAQHVRKPAIAAGPGKEVTSRHLGDIGSTLPGETIMPIFEFQCRKCSEEFERVVFESDADSVTCPQCGSTDTKKQFSVFARSGIGKEGGASCSPPSSRGFS